MTFFNYFCSLNITIASLLFLVLLLQLQGAHARRWEEVISISIYAQSHVDIPRIQFAIEDNPLNVAPTAVLLTQSQPPSDAPSSVPSYYNQEEDEDDDDDDDNDQKNENEAQVGLTTTTDSNNRECPQGEAAYKLNRYDSWGGDGRGETQISIRQVNRVEGSLPTTVAISQDVQLEDYSTTPTTTHNVNAQKRSFVNPRNSWNQGNRGLQPRHLQGEDYVLVGGLTNEDFDSQNICLSGNACYEVAIVRAGETRQVEEAKWEILPVAVEAGTSAAFQSAIAKGMGLSNCTFSLTGDRLSQPNCPFTCWPPTEPEEEELDEQAEEEVDQEQEPEPNMSDTTTTTTAEPISPQIIEGEGANETTRSPTTGPSESVTPQPTHTLTVPSSAPSDAPSLVPTTL